MRDLSVRQTTRSSQDSNVFPTRGPWRGAWTPPLNHPPGPKPQSRPRASACQRNGLALRLTATAGRRGPGTRAHLDAAVVHARRLALDAARVTAPGAALHLHARRPDQEVGGRGVHLAPRYLVDDSPGLAGRRDGLLCRDERRVNVLETPGLWQLPGVQAGVTHGPRLLPTGHVTQTPVQHRQKDPSPQLRAADWPKDEQ